MYRLLHIEPDEAVRVMVLAALNQSPLQFTVAPLPAPPTEPLPADQPLPDAILLGLAPGADAKAALACCRAALPAVPVVVLIENPDLAFARDALRAGADDVVSRNAQALAVLARILLYAIERAVTAARGRALEQRAAGIEAVLDGIFAATAEGLVQTAGDGTIERLSPAAAALFGLDPATAIGTALAEHLPFADRPRLAALLESAAAEPATFAVKVGGRRQIVELAPVALAGELASLHRIVKVGTVEAAFATDSGEPPAAMVTAAAGAAPHAAPRLVQAAVAQGAPGPQRHEQKMPQRQEPSEHHTVARGEAARPPCTLTGAAALAELEEVGRLAMWRLGRSVGNGEGCGFLACEGQAADRLAELAAAGAEDAELATAVDALQLAAWQSVAEAETKLPPRLALEIGYATAASRPHLDRLLADAAALPDDLAGRFVPVLRGVPRGIYVPTLAKTLRALAHDHAKPALHLAELDADYRSLAFGQLAMVVIDITDLKRALGKDGKQVASLLERLHREGCVSVVRGAKGPLAEALRTRLGIAMTVDI